MHLHPWDGRASVLFFNRPLERCRFEQSSRDLGGEAEYTRCRVANQRHGPLGDSFAERRRALHQTLSRLEEEVFDTGTQLLSPYAYKETRYRRNVSLRMTEDAGAVVNTSRPQAKCFPHDYTIRGTHASNLAGFHLIEFRTLTTMIASPD